MSAIARASSRRLLVIVLIGVLGAPPAHAQAQLDDWTAVAAVREGTRVVVTTRDGREIAARLRQMGADAVSLKVRWGRTRTVARADVREVRLGHQLGAGQLAGLGLLAGAVGGLVSGHASSCGPGAPAEECGLASAGGLVFGALLGGVAGLVAGQAVHARPGRLIYAAP